MKKSINAVDLSWNNDITCTNVIKVSEWLAYEEKFSNNDVTENAKRVRDLEERVESIKSDFAKLKEAIREAEWKYFFTTLPTISVEPALEPPVELLVEPATDSATSEKIIKKIIKLEDKVWTWRENGIICGLPYDVYSNKDENLYLFKEGRYYLESEFDKPELVTREMMGYGNNTRYEKNDDDTITILGSGSINVYKMFQEHGRLVTPYHEYENPIIDRERDGNTQP